MQKHSSYRVWGVGALGVAGLLCAASAWGQVIPDEGYPSKPVFPEESPAPPVLHEECGPFLLAHPVTADVFAEECTGNAAGDRDNGLDGAGNGVAGAGSSSAALDPILRTPPRLECPSAVFLEEMETAAIDCHAYDAAGEEHLDYFWEPVGGATRDYLENPRLLPEDAPNPVVVAPSFPQYDTLESFLAEEGAQRYRYRLTATSRATGLSSHAEVEVFVRSSQPSVYCPLEIEVEEGATVVLACEGADPLSFRMDASDAAGASSALWAWEGLWGSSTAPLAATDTPQPLFTAPAGSAGNTYHYVASLTTSSSGVPRTARRRVSVTVKAGEEATLGADVSRSVSNPPAVITCTDIDHVVQDHISELTIECSVENEPAHTGYLWLAISPRDALDRLVSGDYTLRRTFAIDHNALPSNGSIEYKYRVILSVGGRVYARDDVTVTLRKSERRMTCDTKYYEVWTTNSDFSFDCWSDSSSENIRWTVGYGPGARERVYHPDNGQQAPSSLVRPKFDLKFDVPETLPGGAEIRYYTYFVCMYYHGDDGWYYVDSASITVKLTKVYALECVDPIEVYEGEGVVRLNCSVDWGTRSPDSYVWEARGATKNTDLLIADTDTSQPLFLVPDEVYQDETYEYRLVTSVDDDGIADIVDDVTVKVLNKPPDVIIDCPGDPYTYTGGDFQKQLGDCRFSSDDNFPPGPKEYTFVWTNVTSSGKGLLTGVCTTTGDTPQCQRPVFNVPNVSSDETYKYQVTSTVTHADVSASASKIITVHVKPRPPLSLSCTDMRVYEGSGSHDLDCEGVGLPVFAEYEYMWSPDNGLIDEAVPKITFRTVNPPTFRAPASVETDETYKYDITLKSSHYVRPPWSRTSPITVTVLNKPQIVVDCTSDTYSAYEGADVVLDCTATGAHDPSTYTYAWTARSAAADLGRLGSGQHALSPTFTALPSVTTEKTHEYLLTVSADNAVDGTFMVDVTVHPKPQIAVDCPDHPYSVYEGAADFPLDCTATGAPSGSSYTYAWTARSPATDVRLLSDAAARSPTFAVPSDVAAAATHEYLLTVTAANALDGTFEVDVEVLDEATLALLCENPDPVYEGADPVALRCTPSAQPSLPSGSSYAYSWVSLGDAADTNLLVAGAAVRTGSAPPTFKVPADVPQNTTYAYRLTLSADHARDATADVTVTVRDRPAIAVDCTDPAPVYEGSADVALECTATGALGASDGVAYTYAWTAPNNTSATPAVGLLSAPDALSPMFLVPEAVDRDETYEYLLTVSAENSVPGTAEVTVEVLNKPLIAVDCTNPDPVYEGAREVALSCTATGAPERSGYEYLWTARGSTPDMALLSASDVLSPTFDVPSSVAQTTRYEYALTVSAPNAESGRETVTVTVLNEGSLALVCTDPDPVYEGSADIALSCTASGAPGNSPAYEYAWTSRGAAEDADLLSRTDISSPTFDVPAAVDADRAYEYAVRVTAANADAGVARVTVTVLNQPAIAVVCTNPDPVYEGSPDIALSCRASGALGVSGASSASGASGALGDAPLYEYAWTALRNTRSVADTDMLSRTDISSPTFFVPAAVEADRAYEYAVRVTAANAEAGTAEVTVRVLNTGVVALSCANPAPVYEGSGDLVLSCSATGAPAGSEYAYSWEAFHKTSGPTDGRFLSATDVASPTFYVPEDVPQTTRYAYRVTARADHASPATADVTVTVLDSGVLTLSCVNPAPVYEGSPDVALHCTASGGPGGPDGSTYEYAWSPLGNTSGTPDTGLLSATDIASPTFAVPAEVDRDATYAYLVTVSAEHAEAATAEVRVTVLNKPALALACVNPAPVYEGSPDVALNCSATGAPAGSEYEYVWSPLRNTSGPPDTGLLSATDIASPTFAVPAEVDVDATYAYLVTVSAEHAEIATGEVTVTVLNKGALSLVCVNPAPVYEGAPDVALDCSASGGAGAPDGSAYEYLWTALPNTSAAPDTDMLSATDIASPTFAVPEAVDADETYEYLVTVSAENADPATAEVTVTVLNKGALALVCVNPAPVYEGAPDVVLNCSAAGGSGAPDGSAYEYLWTALHNTSAAPDTDLLSATDIASPTFAVPEAVDVDETYEYLVTVSAENAEDATAEVLVTVLNSIPPVAFSTIPSDLGVWISASSLRFGVQSSGSQVTLDALTDRISTSVAGPYHVGRMTLAPEGDLAFDENAEVALSIELVTPVTLRRMADATLGDVTLADAILGDATLDGVTLGDATLGDATLGNVTLGDAALGDVTLGDATLTDATLDNATLADAADEPGAGGHALTLSPSWSMAESCEQLSSQSIPGLYTEVRMSGSDCRLLLFGGDLDLTDAPSGRYVGTIDVIFRTVSGEETHLVPVSVEVIPAPRVIAIGPGGVRFDTSRELPAGLTPEQTVRIYPDVAYLTEEAPSGVFELSNPSLIPLEISVSSRFGYVEATEDGREAVVEDPSSSRLGDLSGLVEMYPQSLVLLPGEQRVVRYGVREDSLAALKATSEAGYAAFFEIASAPRQYIRADWLPEESTGGNTARVTMRVPGAYAPEAASPSLRAELLSVSAGASPSVTFLLETEGAPFLGEVAAYDEDGREIGRSRTLVYTRSRVRLPLAWLPEGESIFLHFAPFRAPSSATSSAPSSSLSGSGHMSEPVRVPWDAPRGIGAVPDRDTSPAFLTF